MIIYSLRNKESHNLWPGLRTQQKPFHSHPHSSGTSSSSLLAYLCSIFSGIYLLRFPCWSPLSSSFTDSYDSSLTLSSIFSYFLTVNLPYFLNLVRMNLAVIGFKLSLLAARFMGIFCFRTMSTSLCRFLINIPLLIAWF